MTFSVYYIVENDDAELPEGAEEEKEVTYDQKVGTLPVPTLKYYDFVGWYTDDGQKVTEDTIYKYAEDKELHAKWQLKKITITFDANKGKFAKDSVSTMQIEATKSIGTMPVVTRKNYKFLGWYKISYVEKAGKKTKQETKIKADTKLGGDMTLTAKWSKVKNPGKVKKLKVKKKNSKSISVTFKKGDKVQGYEVQYATNASFKGAKSVTVKSNKATLKDLKKGKT